MANHFKAEIILLNVWHIPNLIMPTLPVEIIITPDELKNDTESQLKQVRKKLLESKPYTVEIKCKSSNGYSDEEILKAANYENADIIIMGMHGSGFLKEKIMGSIATAVMKNSQKPVLLIPENVQYRHPFNISIATDGMLLPDQRVKEFILSLAEKFKSGFKIVHVSEIYDTSTKNNIEAEFNTILYNIDHSFHFIQDDSIFDGLQNFIASNNIDMMIMIIKQHTFIDKLFFTSNTKKIAFHINIPLLVFAS
jgi:nucleotide-binding universal stress UspA family protein